MLLVTAAGCALFAGGGDLEQLALARALIGLGVSACLMASFKAFSVWFPAERQASLNAAVMAASGLGALTATTPLAWALPVAGGHFPGHLSGRVNTALNLAAFVGAFGLQWGIGVFADLLGGLGLTPPEAFRWSFGALCAAQAAAWGWFV